MIWKKKGNETTIYDVINRNTGLANEFIQPDFNSYYIPNMATAAAWIKYYVQIGVPFSIVGDYDTDGICSTFGLETILGRIGAKKIDVILPKRMSEGYGLSEKIVDRIHSGVLLTVDNGISSVDAIKKAKDKGLIVIIFDHHLAKRENGKVILPPADLIVDPMVEDSLIAKEPLKKVLFRKYCGAGLVYKLSQYLVDDFLQNFISTYAAIATVADVMPLIKDNRNIYKMGIKNIAQNNMSYGLSAIIDLLKTNRIITESDIGFRIAPMLNAPGRIYDEGAMISYKALASNRYSEAKANAETLRLINEDRKILKKEAVARAEKYIEDECLFSNNPIVILDNKTSEGIVGLVSGEICEKYNASTITLAMTKDGYYKGSARAVHGENIKAALDIFNSNYPGILLKYGGHEGAAGLSVCADKIQDFIDGMNKIMPAKKPIPTTIEYDLEINPEDLVKTLNELSKYAPFGEGNPPVVFKINDFKLTPSGNCFYSIIGNDSIKFNGAGCEAIGFSLFNKYRQENYPMMLDMIGMLAYRNYKGNRIPQIELIDFSSSVREEDEMEEICDSIFSIFKSKGYAI